MRRLAAVHIKPLLLTVPDQNKEIATEMLRSQDPI